MMIMTKTTPTTTTTTYGHAATPNREIDRYLAATATAGIYIYNTIDGRARLAG